jgi:chromosome segregation ATPase
MKSTDIFFAETLSRAHEALLNDLRQAEEVLRPASGEELTELRARLRATHAHLTDHFRFEEANGYMETVRKREPRLERTIQQLAEEHHQLAKSLDALIKEAETASNLGDKLRGEVRGWIERVRRHEARETDLVQNAFGLDIGAED